DRDQPLDERPQLLGARHGRRQMLVAKEGCRLVAEHRDAMLRDAAQLSMCDSVSHGCDPVGTGPAPSFQSCEAAVGWSTRMPRLRPIVCRISLISFRLLRPKFFVFSISASVFCTSSRIVRMFAFLRQLYDRTESSSSSTLLSRFSLLTPERGRSLAASACCSAPSSRLMKMFR